MGKKSRSKEERRNMGNGKQRKEEAEKNKRFNRTRRRQGLFYEGMKGGVQGRVRRSRKGERGELDTEEEISHKELR